MHGKTIGALLMQNIISASNDDIVEPAFVNPRRLPSKTRFSLLAAAVIVWRKR